MQASWQNQPRHDMAHRSSEKAILLVEDNPHDAQLTLRAFKKQGISNDVLIATDGAEALEMLFGSEDSEPGPLPMLVLLDLKLPKVSGLEVLQAIRSDKRTRLLPVVIMTTSREQRDIIDSYDLGANSYIRKPVGHEQFNEAVRHLGFYWLLLNEYPPLAE